jgi:hypothetical protein
MKWQKVIYYTDKRQDYDLQHTHYRRKELNYQFLLNTFFRIKRIFKIAMGTLWNRIVSLLFHFMEMVQDMKMENGHNIMCKHVRMNILQRFLIET